MPSVQNLFANTGTILSVAPGSMAAMQGSNVISVPSQMIGMMPPPTNSSAFTMNPGIDLYGGIAIPFTQFGQYVDAPSLGHIIRIN